MYAVVVSVSGETRLWRRLINVACSRLWAAWGEKAIAGVDALVLSMDMMLQRFCRNAQCRWLWKTFPLLRVSRGEHNPSVRHKMAALRLMARGLLEKLCASRWSWTNQLAACATLSESCVRSRCELGRELAGLQIFCLGKKSQKRSIYCKNRVKVVCWI